MLKRDLEVALSISQAAATISTEAFISPPAVDLKEDESPVTRADRDTEMSIRTGLEKYFPEDGIFGEEFGIQGLDNERVWVVDPIDGTKSFITGVPLFGMLLGLVSNMKAELGIIRLPALGTVYSGIIGEGATKDGVAISVSDCQKLVDATLFINEGEKIHAAHPAIFSRLCKAGKLRRMSYDCQPHALVAEGRIDAVVDFDLKPYDYLPVSAVVKAAGGVMTDWHGNELGFESDGRVVTAATPQLHAQLIDLLNA